MGTFNRPTDVAWDAQDNIYISDGYGNSRFVKIAKDGTWVKAVGTHGTGAESVQHAARHRRRTAQGNVYVADRGNNRIQVYDTDIEFKASYRRRRRAVERPGDAEVHLQRRRHRQDLPAGSQTGKLLGWMQTGMGQGQTGCIIHELHAVSDNVLIKGSCSEWNVEKITFK